MRAARELLPKEVEKLTWPLERLHSLRDKLLLTNVVNQALPLIRYELTDEVTFLDEPNPDPWTDFVGILLAADALRTECVCGLRHGGGLPLRTDRRYVAQGSEYPGWNRIIGSLKCRGGLAMVRGESSGRRDRVGRVSIGLLVFGVLMFSTAALAACSGTDTPATTTAGQMATAG